MKNLSILLKLSLVIALVAFVACDRTTVTEPQVPTDSDRGIFGIPAGPIDSAFFSIYVGIATNQTVNIHRATAAWDEATVTWNSFGAAYDPAIVGSFNTNAVGWVHVNVTALVQAWIDGLYPNYGILLEQGATSGTVYPSSEYITQFVRPMLKVCYTNGGAVCETFQEGLNGIVPDAYIWALNPNTNYGNADRLYTGLINDFEKQSLLFFEITVEPPPDSGCTLTIGYWKTHAGFGRGNQGDAVTPLLPIWLGTPGGTDSYQVTTALMAVNFLSQNVYGDPSNGITKLYAQLLGAKLNGENGADLTSVAAVIAAADAFLADHNYTEWSGLSDADKDMVLVWHEMLDEYNNGIIGPLHCD